MAGRAARAWTPGTPHDASALGVATHRLIALSLAAGLRTPDRAFLDRALSALATLDLPHVYGLAARQRVLCAVGRYLLRFVPGDAWTLCGVEVPLRRSRLDLLFLHVSGTVGAHEIKSGAFAAIDDRERVLREVEIQATDGREAYGAAFLGVRACLLAAPASSSRFITPEGIRDSNGGSGDSYGGSGE